MKSIKFTCNAVAADTLEVSEIKNIGITQFDIEIYEGPMVSIQLNKEKLVQLRDFINLILD